MTTPGYPVFGTHAQYLGGEVYNLPLTEENNFLPQLGNIADILGRAKAIVVNYPNNPTGASATIKFFEELVSFAKENDLIVIQDAAYSALIFELRTHLLPSGSWCQGCQGGTALPLERLPT